MSKNALALVDIKQKDHHSLTQVFSILTKVMFSVFSLEPYYMYMGAPIIDMEVFVFSECFFYSF